MIRLIAMAAFALAVATSAEAMSPPPLHQSDGISTDARYYGYRGYMGPAMESSATKCAGARCGVQGTFAVSGYIETR